MGGQEKNARERRLSSGKLFRKNEYRGGVGKNEGRGGGKGDWGGGDFYL